MKTFIKWFLIFCLLYYAYDAGWFTQAIKYCQETFNYGKQEKVIHEEDGSVTTVKYRNVVDIMKGQ